MTTARTKAPPASSATDAADIPWYDLLDVPEPPEDGLLEDDIITLIKAILLARYANDLTVLVLGPSVYLVYDSEKPGSFVAPDCYVMFGVDANLIRLERRSYRIDEWGIPPAFVLEVGSPSTAHRDLGEKRAIYARMGAREYWRLDRNGEYYGEPLVGERLVNGEYERFELYTEANGDTWSRSEALGVDFYHWAEDGIGWFSMRDSKTGEWLNTLGEEIAAHAQTEAARQVAEARAQAEREARQTAEARNQELQAALERMRRQLGQ